MAHPSDRPRSDKQCDRCDESQWDPDWLPPEPRGQHGQPGNVTEPGRREAVEQPVFEIYPCRNPRPHARQTSARAPSRQWRRLTTAARIGGRHARVAQLAEQGTLKSILRMLAFRARPGRPASDHRALSKYKLRVGKGSPNARPRICRSMLRGGAMDSSKPIPWGGKSESARLGRTLPSHSS